MFLARTVLVVADQNNLTALAGEGSHAVGPPRHEQAVVHLVTLAAYDPVFEACRQVENALRIRNEPAETGSPVICRK